MPSPYPLTAVIMEVKSTNSHKVGVIHNHSHVVVGRSSTPTSPNPLDNEVLRRRSTGLSAFNDYVDLVKRHLMYAVREEVEILKQQIGEMMERIGQLEYENTVLRSEARPETLNKLLQPRVVTSSQPTVPGQATPMLITPAPQQTPAQPPSQPQPSLQTTHPPPQQHLSQTTTAQAPQPPPSTSSS